jgi:hypothetical protein
MTEETKEPALPTAVHSAAILYHAHFPKYANSCKCRGFQRGATADATLLPGYVVPLTLNSCPTGHTFFAKKLSLRRG